MNEDLAALERRENTLGNERRARVNQILREIQASQNTRDQKRQINLTLVQKLASVNNFNALGEEFRENKEDLIKIIDEYLEAVRARLKRRRADMKYLSQDLRSKRVFSC